MAINPTFQPAVKSAIRTLDLIEYVVAHPGGVGAKEISDALTIPVSSLSYLLATLVERGYFVRDGRRYVAGPVLDRLRLSPAERSLADRAQPLIKAMRVQLDETVSLFELIEWELVAVITEVAERSLRYSIEVGTRTPLHCVAAGKAFLAAMSDTELGRYFAESRRERFTPNSLTSERDLRREIGRVRAIGYARTLDEYSIGIAAIGTAISIKGRPVAALSVAIPSPRFTPDVEARVVEQFHKTHRLLENDG